MQKERAIFQKKKNSIETSRIEGCMFYMIEEFDIYHRKEYMTSA